MSNNSSAQRTGVGFAGLLTILFIGLKLTGYIKWSWWLVLLPSYGGLALIVVVVVLYLLLLGILKLLAKAFG
jgi:hypothetical protein